MPDEQTKSAQTNGVTPSAPVAATAQVAAPKRVFRTYASDLAALGHLPDSRIQKAPAPAPAKPAPIKEAHIVVAPEPEKAPEPQLVQPARPPLPPPMPKAPPQPVVLPTDDERNAILARLRLRTETNKKMQAPEPEPAPRPRPVPPTPAPVNAPVESGPSPIHTYKSDFADNISVQGASAASVLAAQADAPRRASSTAPVRKSGVLFAVFGIVIVLVGAGGIYAAYQYSQTDKILPIVATAPSLIFVDDKQEISGSGHELLAALANAADATLGAGNVRQVYISQQSAGALGTTTSPAPGGALVAALALPMPDILLRSIQPASTVGIVNAGSEQRAFFILKVDSFERSFAGMLAWEPSMAQDLGLLYPAYPAPAAPVEAPANIATTTATSTPKTKGKAVAAPAPVVVAAPAPLAFDDEVVASHDVRVLRDSNGKSLIIYGFWDQTTLIIARDEAAFSELVNRLATTRQQ